MKTVSIHEAQQHLATLLAEAAAGEEIWIADEFGTRLARIDPEPARDRRDSAVRTPGFWKDAFQWDDRFFDPLPSEEIDGWEGRGSLWPS